MGRKNYLKCRSWLRKSRKESGPLRSPNARETKSQQTISSVQTTVPRAVSTDERPEWMLLFDIKTDKKLKLHKSYPEIGQFTMTSFWNFNCFWDERLDTSCKLSSVLGDITIEDWSCQSYLSLMTQRDGEQYGILSSKTSDSCPKKLQDLNEQCYYAVPRLQHLAEMAVKKINLNSIDALPISIQEEHLRDPKPVNNTHFPSVPSLRRLCQTVVDSLPATTKSTVMDSSKGPKPVHLPFVPLLRDLCQTDVDSLSVTTNSTQVDTLENPKPDTDTHFFVPSLLDLCKMVLRSSKSGPKRKIPALMDLDIPRPRFRRPFAPPMFGFPRPWMGSRFPQRPMLPSGMTGQWLWRTTGPPACCWPMGGAFERHGIPPFTCEYLWF